MSNVEMEKLEELQKQLKSAVDESAKSGDLTRAKDLRNEFEEATKKIEAGLDPLRHLHPDLKQLVELESTKRMEIVVGGVSAAIYYEKLLQRNVLFSSVIEEMLAKPGLMTLKQSQSMELIRFKVSDLGIKGKLSTASIYKRAKAIGLQLCPIEVGLELRLTDIRQPKGQAYFVAIDPVEVAAGTKHIFGIYRSKSLCLLAAWVDQDDWWNDEAEIIFRLG